MNAILDYPTIDGWEDIPISENHESLVSLQKLKHPSIRISPQYFQQKIDGSINDCWVRESVADRLIKATRRLPNGFQFLIWDTWRPLAVQTALFLKFKKIFKNKYPFFSEMELQNYTKKYVSLPSTDPNMPSPHSTGGAVDLTLTNSKGIPLYMGTNFDEMGEKACTRYYESKLNAKENLSNKEREALWNRRLLYFVMLEVGFTNYFEEWWHFDYGNQFWGKVKGQQAFYGFTTPPRLLP